MNPRALILFAFGTAVMSFMLFPQWPRAGEKIVLSPMAVADSVKENSLAAKEGIKPGDVFVGLNGRQSPSLEELFAYHFESANTRETLLKIKRGVESIESKIQQGDWGCSFRADLGQEALKRLTEARVALNKDQSAEEARRKWEALADDVEKKGFRSEACWLRLALGKALGDKRDWKDVEAVLDRLERDAPKESFWAFAATLERAKALGAEGENERAEAEFQKARDLAKVSGRELRLAAMLSHWFFLEFQRERYTEAKALAEESLAIRERLVPGSRAVAGSQNNVGVACLNQGDLDAAKEHHLKALAIEERLAPDSLELANNYNNLGSIADEQGDSIGARGYSLKALVIQKRLAPDSLAMAESLSNLGVVANEQGDLATAREYHLKALAIRERLAPGTLAVAASFNNLGIVTYCQGDLAAATEYHLRAMAIEERLAPGSLDVAASLINLGVVANEEGDLAAAKDYYLKALAIEETQAPDSLDLAADLINLGVVADDQGDFAAAKGYYLRALAIQERLAPDSLPVSSCLNDLGVVARGQGDLAVAKEYHLKALAIRERLEPGSLDVADCLQNLAVIEKAYGNLPRCAQLRAEAVDALEAQRTKAGGESAKSSFSAAHGAFYTDLIAAYLDTNKPELALETLERSRARALLEMVSSRFVDLKGEIPEPLIERQRDLASQRKALYDKLSQSDANTDPKDIDSWRSELLMLPQKEDALAEEIRKASPRLASLEYPKPLRYSGIVDTLEPETLLLAFAVAEKETYLFSLLKGKTGPCRFQAKRLGVGRKEIENHVRALRAALGPEAATGPDPGAWEKQARALYETLLAPVSKEIAASRKILILPDGPLHALPFSVLIPDGKKLPKDLERKPLGLQRPIAIEASMTVYAELKARSAKTAGTGKLSWIGFGDPTYASTQKGDEGRGELGGLKTRGYDLGPLPGTRKEIETIAALFGPKGRALLGAEATEAAVRALSEETCYLHFACHGLLDQAFPMNSALALSAPASEGQKDVAAIGDNRKDGLLQAWEIIQDVKLDGDCVVLSACETGGGKILGGEGIIGLTRAFFYAGARSTVVSLWTISDESTAMLMEAFYREVLAGAPRDVALQRAQTNLARSTRYAHPFYWAAFQLHGRAE